MASEWSKGEDRCTQKTACTHTCHIPSAQVERRNDKSPWPWSTASLTWSQGPRVFTSQELCPWYSEAPTGSQELLCRLTACPQQTSQRDKCTQACVGVVIHCLTHLFIQPQVQTLAKHRAQLWESGPNQIWTLPSKSSQPSMETLKREETILG